MTELYLIQTSWHLLPIRIRAEAVQVVDEGEETAATCFRARCSSAFDHHLVHRQTLKGCSNASPTLPTHPKRRQVDQSSASSPAQSASNLVRYSCHHSRLLLSPSSSRLSRFPHRYSHCLAGLRRAPSGPQAKEVLPWSHDPRAADSAERRR